MIKTLEKMNGYNFTDKYYANENGIVYFNKKTGYGNSKRYKHDIVKSFINKYGYIEYILSDKDNSRKHISSHRIVAKLFIPNPNNKPQVNHIDGNKKNNNKKNLEWVTQSENELHNYNILGKKNCNKGKQLPSGKSYRGTIREVHKFDMNCVYINSYFNPTEAEKDGFNLKHISSVCNGKMISHMGFRWSYSKDEPYFKKQKRKHPGVIKRKDTGRYSAEIMWKKKKYNIGCFDTLKEGIIARNQFLDENKYIKLSKTEEGIL